MLATSHRMPEPQLRSAWHPGGASVCPRSPSLKRRLGPVGDTRGFGLQVCFRVTLHKILGFCHFLVIVWIWGHALVRGSTRVPCVTSFAEHPSFRVASSGYTGRTGGRAIVPPPPCPSAIRPSWWSWLGLLSVPGTCGRRPCARAPLPEAAADLLGGDPGPELWVWLRYAPWCSGCKLGGSASGLMEHCPPAAAVATSGRLSHAVQPRASVPGRMDRLASTLAPFPFPEAPEVAGAAGVPALSQWVAFGCGLASVFRGGN